MNENKKLPIPHHSGDIINVVANQLSILNKIIPCRTILLALEDRLVEEIQKKFHAELNNKVTVIAIQPGYMAFDYMVVHEVHLILCNITLPFASQGWPYELTNFIRASKALYPQLPIVAYSFEDFNSIDSYSVLREEIKKWKTDTVVYVKDVGELLGEANKILYQGDHTRKINEEIKNNNIDTLSRLFLAYALSDRQKEAENIYNRIIEAGQNKAEAYFNFGSFCIDNGQFKKAIEVLKKGLEIKPDDYFGHCRLGLAYATEGLISSVRGLQAEAMDYHRVAIENYKYAIKCYPHFSSGYKLLAQLYSDKDMHQEAIEALKRAIDIEPSNTEAHFDLGKCYLISGQKQFALDEYHILQKLDPVLAETLFNEIYK